MTNPFQTFTDNEGVKQEINMAEVVRAFPHPHNDGIVIVFTNGESLAYNESMRSFRHRVKKAFEPTSAEVEID